MTQRRWQSCLFVLPVLVLAFFLVGCPKRPATTTAAAPAPTAGAPSPMTPSAPPGAGVQPQPSGPVTAGPSMAPAAPTRPAMPARPPLPKEFQPSPALKPIHFDFDKYDVRPGDARILDENARWLKANANYLVLIEGHADERGTNEYNLALGERRAKATLNYLVAQGVQANRLTIISYGEERPLCGEKNEECWAQNRRAQFLVKPQ